MKKIILITLTILNIYIYIPTIAQSKKLILEGIIIVIDPGHGGKDTGTFHGDIYEKDINLSISIILKKELEKYGAKVYLTREGDYDLSSPQAYFRKKSDFDNRIQLTNKLKPNLFISIHQNYYKTSKYKGAQVFYKESKEVAGLVQEKLNKDRSIKEIPRTLYMFNKIDFPSILIECGFLSNEEDRKKLLMSEYQQTISEEIRKAIIEYFLN